MLPLLAWLLASVAVAGPNAPGSQDGAGEPALPKADDALPEADDDLPEADDALPEADDDLPEADDAAPEADGEEPWPDDDDTFEIIDEEELVLPPADDGADTDLLGDEPEATGETAEDYRVRADELAVLPPDEEIEGWTTYLAAHPASPYRGRIESRIEELTDALYAERPGDDAPEAPDDELRLAQGVLLEDFDPRTRIKAGFQWGLPDWLDLFADYEHALHRQLSVHGGVRHRLSGWSIETGARWAPVKSMRSGTIVSILADARFNASPAFAAVRPQVAWGQRVGPIDLAVIGGADVELREGGGPTWLGGANVTWRAADSVRVFLEAEARLKHPGWPTGAFQYQTATLGIEFLMGRGGARADALTAALGAGVPYFYRWWLPSYGAASGRFDVNLDDLPRSP